MCEDHSNRMDSSYEQPKRAEPSVTLFERKKGAKNENGDVEKINESANVIFVAKSNFVGEVPGDLSISRGDHCIVKSTRSDGWWLVEHKNSKQQGLVPSTFLSPLNPYEEILDNSAPASVGSRVPQNTITSSYASKIERVRLTNSVIDIYKNKLDDQIMERDPRIEMILPPGCTFSPLFIRERSNKKLSIEFHILPKLSKTGLGFHDLYWSLAAGKVIKRRVKFMKMVKILKCENMPAEVKFAQNFTVIHRFVRFCLFDDSRILSNIHTVRAQCTKNRPHLWTFFDKITPTISCIELSSFFVRSNYADPHVKLLIETGCGIFDTKNNKYAELCIGWNTLDLTSEHGKVCLVDNKNYVVTLKSGTPFHKDARQSEEISQKDNPRLIIRFTDPNSDLLEQLDSLPDTLVYNTLFIQFLYWYRQLAGEIILKRRLKEAETSAVIASICTLIPDSFLASFPKAAACHEIMDVAQVLWEEKWKLLVKSEKKCPSTVAWLFYEFFMEVGFPLLQRKWSSTFNEYSESRIEADKKAAEDFLKIYRKYKNCAHWLNELDGTLPLDLSQLIVDLSNVYAE